MKQKLIFIRFIHLILFCAVLNIHAQNKIDDKLNIVVIGAHPDDCDIKMGGTAILFAQMGHNVKFISVTNGDAGHFEKGGGALAKIRRNEALEAGKRFGIKEYKVLDNHDAELFPTLNIRHQLIREIRSFNADIVVSHRPVDYHPDHRYTGILVQDSAYLVIVPNAVSDTPPLKTNPVFLYLQDNFKKPYPFQPDIAVDITAVFEKKIKGLDAHKSQFYEWLPWTSGDYEKVPESEADRLDFLSKVREGKITSNTRESLIKWYGEKKGNSVKYAEAFEICEYGKQPTEEEILALFPMLNPKE